MNAAAETETKTLDIDVGGWPTCSGASVTLYLRPAAERDCGRPLVYSFGHVGSGTPAMAFNNRELFLGTVGVETSAESLRDWLEGRADELIELSDAYEGTAWDGHNHVGHWGLTDDARLRFESALEQAFAWGEINTFWDAGDWFDQVRDDVLDAVLEKGVDAFIESELEEAERNGALLRGDDVAEYIEDLLQHALEEIAEVDPYGEPSETRVRRDRIRALLDEAPREIDIADAVFHTPRSYDGQDYECSYAGCEDGIVLRITDHAQPPGGAARVTYYLAPFEALKNPEFSPWNDEEPELVEGGEWIDAVPKESS